MARRSIDDGLYALKQVAKAASRMEFRTHALRVGQVNSAVAALRWLMLDRHPQAQRHLEQMSTEALANVTVRAQELYVMAASIAARRSPSS